MCSTKTERWWKTSTCLLNALEKLWTGTSHLHKRMASGLTKPKTRNFPERPLHALLKSREGLLLNFKTIIWAGITRFSKLRSPLFQPFQDGYTLDVQGPTHSLWHIQKCSSWLVAWKPFLESSAVRQNGVPRRETSFPWNFRWILLLFAQAEPGGPIAFRPKNRENHKAFGCLSEDGQDKDGVSAQDSECATLQRNPAGLPESRILQQGSEAFLSV